MSAPELERLRVFEAVLRLVEWSCADRPVLLAVDDAHRADRASLRLTAHLGRRLGGLPVAARADPAATGPRPRWTSSLADLAGRAWRHASRRRADHDAERGRAGRDPAAGRRRGEVHQVVAAAEGNPLLAMESARVLAAGDSGPPPEPARPPSASRRAGCRPPPGRWSTWWPRPDARWHRRAGRSRAVRLARPRRPPARTGCWSAATAGSASGTTCCARRCTSTCPTRCRCTTGSWPRWTRATAPRSPST